ncbi:hypothetical protein GF402_01530 [Candidatus Fermentibacteria bacterium]|nr:hypothetical protein [Candidatus Fermentibacteria bacterium]
MRIGIALLVGLMAVAFADLPEFSSPFFVQASGVDLVVDGSVPDPYVADWDGDGVKDLIVGQFSQGKIRLYLNSGTNASPVFTTYSFLQADGSDITMSYG